MSSNRKSDKIRRNVDLSRKAIIILQWQAVALGFGTVKPYMETHLEQYAKRILTRNPALKKLLIKPGRK